MPSLEMLRKLLDEFAEKEAHTREEINVISQRIEELEQHILISQHRLSELALDRDKVLMMRSHYTGGEERMWSGPADEPETAPQPTPAAPAVVAAAPPAAARPSSFLSARMGAAPVPAPAVSATAAASPPPPSTPTPAPAPAPTPGPIAPTTTNQDIRERLRPGRSTASYNNLEAISPSTSAPTAATPAPPAATPAPTVAAAAPPPPPPTPAPAPPPPPPTPAPPPPVAASSPVTIAALSPRNTGTKIPALQPPPPPPPTPAPTPAPEPPLSAEPAASTLFTSEAAQVSSSNPFSAPIYQPPEPAPHTDPYAPVLEPNSSFGMSSQAEYAAASFPMEAAAMEPAPQAETHTFPVPEDQPASQPAYSGTNESNYMQSAAQPAAQDQGDNPFFRQVGSINRPSVPPPPPPPPTPPPALEQSQTASTYDLQMAASYQQAAAPPEQAPSYDPYAEQYANQANQDPYQAPSTPQPDPYLAPTATPGQDPQPPQISDFDEEESDDTVKSINDALRGLFR